MTSWLASIPLASVRQQIGTMTLTQNRLVVCEDRLFTLSSIALGAVGEFTLPGSSLIPSASEFGSQPKSVVTIAVDGRITLSGPATHLMVLLLAHGLREWFSLRRVAQACTLRAYKSIAVVLSSIISFAFVLAVGASLVVISNGFSTLTSTADSE
jgi:hypothetical protein